MKGSAHHPYWNFPDCFSLPRRCVDGTECSECGVFVACQHASQNPPKVLTLHVFGEYFHQIYSGEKTEEYRERTEYWKKRINGHHYDVIEICRGYPAKGENAGRIFFSFIGVDIVEICLPTKGEPVSAFSIPLRRRLSCPAEGIRVGAS